TDQEHEGRAHPQIIAASIVSGIEQVAQAVTGEIEREREREDREPRPPRHPRRRVEKLLRGVEHRAPGRRRRLYAESEKRQDGLRDDGDRNRDRGLDKERAYDVWQDVPAHQAKIAG